MTISRGFASRPVGQWIRRRSSAAGSSPKMFSSSGVSTGPGQSAFTRTPCARELHGELAAHREHRALRRRVRDLRRRRAEDRDERRDVDHRAAAPLEQVRDPVLAAEEDALRVHGLHAVPRLDRRCRAPTRRRPARCPRCCRGRRCRRSARRSSRIIAATLRLVGDVDLERERRRRRTVADRLLGGAELHVGDADLRALLREEDRRLAAHAAAGAGDHATLPSSRPTQPPSTEHVLDLGVALERVHAELAAEADCLKPPNGVECAHGRVRVDARGRRPRSRARRAARARRRASRSSPRARTACRSRAGSRPPRRRTGSRAATGPKTSSRAMRSSFDASTSVPGTRSPARSASRRGRAARRRRTTRPSRGAAAEISGPISVASSAGSPTFTPRVASTSSSDEAVVGATARRGSASARSSPGRRCRRRRTAPRRPPARGRRPRRRRSPDLPPSSSVTRLIVPAAPLHHPPPDLGRAGEADLRDVRMLDEPRADDRALADDDVDDALRDPRLERELGEPQRRERRQLGRLQHDRVAARERRPELPATRC